MNRGQLTSLAHCNKCGYPIEILPHWTEAICKNCNAVNDLVMKDFWCKRDKNVNKIETLIRTDDFRADNKIIKKLNTDKIKTLDDVKRVLEFLDIKIEIEEGITRKGLDKIKDLFE